jgi:hypothetical protein
VSFTAKSLVQVPLPGECVYGIAAAFVQRWFRGSRQGAALLFDGTAPAARDIPARLPQLAASLPPDLGLDAARLALLHTALPIHLPFYDEERQAALFRAIDLGQAMQLRLGTAPARVTCARALRLCPKCVRRDRAKFGRAYWHREHQLPGVLTCPVHDCALVVTSVRPESTHGAAIFTAPDRACPVAHERLDAKEGYFARRLSREMAWLLRTEIPRPGPGRLHAYYRHLLHAAGYNQPNGSVAVARLCADLTSYFGRPFLRRLGCLPGCDFGWVAALARSPRSHQQPLRHLLLLIFLRRSVAHLKEAMAFTPYSPTGKPHPFRIRNPTRLRRLRPEKRRAWLKIICAERAKTAKDLAVYAWLYRNDRAWLRSHRGARANRSVDTAVWNRRDAKLAMKIPRLAAKIMRERPARRASRSAIASALGATSWLVQDHAHLPRSVAAIKTSAESAVAYAIRRINLIRVSPQIKSPLPVWKLRTLAGISTALSRKKAVATVLHDSANESYTGAAARAERKR